MGGSFLSQFKGFDAYAKTLEDFRVKTIGGGLITIIATLCILTLLVSEFVTYQSVETRPELVVDKTRKQKLSIFVNVTFPRMPCYLLSIDVMNASGEHLNDIAHDMYKTRLDPEGRVLEKEKEKELGDKSHEAVEVMKEIAKADEKSETEKCGDCYGGLPPEGGCCETCNDVKDAYLRKGWSFNNPDGIEQCIKEGWTEKIRNQANEGCNVQGHLKVSKVAGNFHIAPGSSFNQGNMHVHDILPYIGVNFDFSHEIHHLSFGDTFEGAINPLDRTTKKTEQGNQVFQYYVKVVGTMIRYKNGSAFRTNQYSVTQYDKPSSAGTTSQLPGFFVNFEISPLMVIYTEHKRSFSQFITGVCSIIGGIFTVAGLIDGVVYKAETSFRRKVELGKAS